MKPANGPVPCTHIEAASLASGPVDRDRGRTVSAIPFIAVALDRCQRPFRISTDVGLDTLACLFRREDRNNGRGKPACPATHYVSIRLTFIYTQFQRKRPACSPLWRVCAKAQFPMG